LWVSGKICVVSDDSTGWPLGVDGVRPFVTAQDFQRSHRFYEALGWSTVWTVTDRPSSSSAVAPGT